MTLLLLLIGISVFGNKNSIILKSGNRFNQNIISRLSLNSKQIKNLGLLAKSFAKYGDGNIIKFAFIVANVWHESRLMPINEILANPQKQPNIYNRQMKYWNSGFFGRGFIQLTHLENYRRVGVIMGYDFVNNPNLVLNPAISAEIAVRGMIRGWFTGKRLSHYINGEGTDFINARRIVNGLDQAEKIKGYTLKILQK